MAHVKQNVLKDLCRPYLPAGISLIVFSFFSTTLNLVPPVFMMQLSERVMLSRNETTLVFLTLIAVFLILVLTGIETIRARTVARISIALDAEIAEKVFDRVNRRGLRMSEAAKNQCLYDLNTFRDFIGGPVVMQICDVIWVPFVVLIMFAMHPILGASMMVILTIIAGLSLGNQWAVGTDVKRAQAASAEALEFARAVRQSSDSTRPMGMIPALVRGWRSYYLDSLGWMHHAAARSEWWGASLRFVRNFQLIGLLVVGSLLYLNQQINAGAVFGVIYIAMRAVAPVSAVSSSWRAIWNFVLASERLNVVLAAEMAEQRKMPLPRPRGAISVSRVVLSPPNSENIVLGDVSFALRSGRILGVVGPSGAGKSSLANLLVGTWRPQRGTVHLDDHDLTHWDEDQLGAFIGYVPQEYELLPGTVAENIARFSERSDVDHEAIIEAAELAGIEDVIRDLPDGYNTRVGSDGHIFSGGQRQRIALARAVYGDPALLVLDEPNSNLDAVGEQTLGRTIMQMKKRGATIVLITHRMSMLQFCDDLLVMNAGTVHTYGGRDAIMNRLPAYRLQPAAQLEEAVS